jgi:F-type H+-transporting ATPase subunit gamma
MAALKDIRQRISAVQNISKITQAMRMVSVAKLKRAQDAIQSARPYFQKMNDILANLVESVGEDYSHPLIQNRTEIKNIVAIVVSSDKGMCGSFNNNLFKFAVNYIEKELLSKYPDAKVKVIPVGKKTCQFFDKAKYEVIERFPGIFANLSFSVVKDIISLVDLGFARGDIDRVIVFNNEFKNMITQIPAQRTLLPLETSKIDADIFANKKAKKAQPETKEDNKSQASVDYIFEPDKKKILDEMLPTNLDIQLWRALLESNAAEHAARMMAMENATNNALDLIKHLQLVFNKARQSAITTEMLEIVSGAEALNNN